MSIVIKTSVADFLFLFFLVVLSCCVGHCSCVIEAICQGDSIRDDTKETLISDDGNFQLGFFSPGNSTLRYVGIWYHPESTGGEKVMVWVANRDAPISDRNGVLRIGNDGNLVISDGNNTTVWNSSAEVPPNNTVAFLLSTGNLVLSNNYSPLGEDCGRSYNGRSYNGESHHWQSFDNPSDTMWRSGYWDGSIFTGVPNITDSFLDGFSFASFDENGTIYLTYTPSKDTAWSMIRIGWDGKWEQWKQDDDIIRSTVLKSEPANDSEFYNFCGNSGVYDVSKSPKCSCLPGFEPNNAEEWNRGIWTNGCARRTELQCSRTPSSSEVGKEDGFLKLKMMKLPDFFNKQSVNSEDECRSWCLNNCSCIAYAYDGFIGCMSCLHKNLTDTAKFSSGGKELYIKLAYSEFDKEEKEKLIIIITAISIGTIYIFCTFFLWRHMDIYKRRARDENIEDIVLFDRGKTSTSKVELQEAPLFKFVELTTATNNFNTAYLLGQGGFGSVYRGTLHNGQEIAVKRLEVAGRSGQEGSQVNRPELPLFNFKCVAAATNNFSEESKLGQGGFGPVYKGELPGGQQIAVKRLSKASRQGLEEFKNEVLVISNLQHRNLVKLLGYSVEGEEKILVYEYMPNNSLDTYLFDQLKKELLQWRERFHIIEGISRDLLYLHQDSRLRIIHRDLKASNVLLDESLKPKISDFGLARVFGDNEDQANTKRVVGTYGYMSPEYAMDGLFSEKSDVFSYGVLLLEIVSGRRNTSFYNDKHLSLVGYAWTLRNEGNILALVDNLVSDPCHREEVLRCIHVGLLCVQQFAKDRPDMSTAILMLNGVIVDLPSPKQPAFTQRQNNASHAKSPPQHDQQECSLNNVTLSTVEGR
ncbi:hypothetical protein SLEP1_g39617 [Rubroshorea leprosula]|uniref:Receptor-like serine/threonine-protein kinase n=1 Tax=Rubroshorea leprosula TaxID=152421 RepID=A0AAV5L0Z8_9ROSI|nr:hypothetical protein SLEP1_g39617 [Rubroshorea leprosula]